MRTAATSNNISIQIRGFSFDYFTVLLFAGAPFTNMV